MGGCGLGVLRRGLGLGLGLTMSGLTLLGGLTLLVVGRTGRLRRLRLAVMLSPFGLGLLVVGRSRRLRGLHLLIVLRLPSPDLLIMRRLGGQARLLGLGLPLVLLRDRRLTLA